MKEFKLRLEVEPCIAIDEACAKAQTIADQIKLPVEFEFNSVDCVAVPGGDWELLSERQQEASRSRPRVTSSEED